MPNHIKHDATDEIVLFVGRCCVLAAQFDLPRYDSGRTNKKNIEIHGEQQQPMMTMEKKL